MRICERDERADSFLSDIKWRVGFEGCMRALVDISISFVGFANGPDLCRCYLIIIVELLSKKRLIILV